MSKPIPQIQKYMTTVPKSVDKTAPLLEAATLMQKEGFRHLPVIFAGKIEGILSMTDVNLVTAIKEADISRMRVLDAFTPNAFTVSPEAPIDEVCRLMAQNKYGCVLVEDNQQVVGIFTWIDALKTMDELLHTRLKD